MKKINKMIQRLINIITSITPKQDKLAHFFWGFIYSAIGFIAYPLYKELIFILVVPTIASLLKEVLDSKNKDNTVEFLDIVYTIAPGVIILLMLLLSI